MVLEKIVVKNANINNLKNLSLEIPLNKYVVFVGKSGSGKSTLAVDVIVSGYYKKHNNIVVPTKPDLFKQKTTVLTKSCSLYKYLKCKKNTKNTNITILDYCEKADNINLKSEEILYIIKQLDIDNISLDDDINTFSLTMYNKIRFLKLILNSDAKLFIIDEICAGMMFSEAKNIAKIFSYLAKRGYSIIAIEHSFPIIESADYVVELGPEAGINGGNIAFNGELSIYKKTVSWNKFVASYKQTVKSSQISKKLIKISQINYNNFKSFELKVPLNGIISICGITGSGKSSLLDVLFIAMDKSADSWKNKNDIYGEVLGKSYLRRPYIIDQTPIGDNSMSTPATYTGIMNTLRDMYFLSDENKKIKLNKSDFSYNSTGKCPYCKGKGCIETEIEGEIFFNPCKKCNGLRYNQKLDNINLYGYNIGKFLSLSCEEALSVLSENKINNSIKQKLNFLKDVGLSYLCLGQPSATLSGGESQRIKITKELSKKLGDRCLFLLDSPSKGLFITDLFDVIKMLKMLVSKNNTVVIADNNPLFIQNSDWIIYLDDGKAIYEGQPKNIPQNLKVQLGIVD